MEGCGLESSGSDTDRTWCLWTW